MLKADAKTYDHLSNLKEKLEAGGTKCSGIEEIEPGVFTMFIGVPDDK